MGHAVAQLVGALRYKPESREFDSRWYQWNDGGDAVSQGQGFPDVSKYLIKVKHPYTSVDRNLSYREIGAPKIYRKTAFKDGSFMCGPLLAPADNTGTHIFQRMSRHQGHSASAKNLMIPYSRMKQSSSKLGCFACNC
jgi:hypothetical protein